MPANEDPNFKEFSPIYGQILRGKPQKPHKHYQNTLPTPIHSPFHPKIHQTPKTQNSHKTQEIFGEAISDTYNDLASVSEQFLDQKEAIPPTQKLKQQMSSKNSQEAEFFYEQFKQENIQKEKEIQFLREENLRLFKIMEQYEDKFQRFQLIFNETEPGKAGKAVKAGKGVRGYSSPRAAQGVQERGDGSWRGWEGVGGYGGGSGSDFGEEKASLGVGVDYLSLGAVGGLEGLGGVDGHQKGLGSDEEGQGGAQNGLYEAGFAEFDSRDSEGSVKDFSIIYEGDENGC